MFSGCTKLIGGAGTKYNSSYVDKTYARIDGGTSNPGYFTDIADKPSTFPTDSWATIVASVKANNKRGYKVGDTKTVDLGTYGTHTLRIANTSTPSECSRTGFSQTACGFVLEFADIITNHKMNDTAINLTRALDYYTSIGVTTSSYSGAIKKNGTSAAWWWLRAAYSNITNFFLDVSTSGSWIGSGASASDGVAPAFRLG